MNPDLQAIHATIQRSNPAECTNVGEYVIANAVSAWLPDRPYKFSPEIYEMKNREPHLGPMTNEEIKYTIWIFQPREFRIASDVVTMFVRIQ